MIEATTIVHPYVDAELSKILVFSDGFLRCFAWNSRLDPRRVPKTIDARMKITQTDLDKTFNCAVLGRVASVCRAHGFMVL